MGVRLMLIAGYERWDQAAASLVGSARGAKAGLPDLIDRGCQGRLGPPARLPQPGAARDPRMAVARPPGP
jgi:hypothetical protein